MIILVCLNATTDNHESNMLSAYLNDLQIV
jgi:hypothetical protein